MAKKKGAVTVQEKHDQKTSAEIALLEKQSEIKKIKRKRKFFVIPTTKGFTETTDPKKWEEYNKSRVYV